MADSGGHKRREMLVPLNVRNYRIAICNGTLSVVGLRLADDSTIIPLLVLRLSGLAWMVGLTLALSTLARTLTQLVAARRLDTLERKKPYYILSSVIRACALLIIAAALFWAREMGLGLAVWVVLGGLVIRAGGGALANLSFMDIVAKSNPTTRRGSLWLWRRTLGLIIAAAVVAPFVRYLIGPDSPFPFPLNFGVLFTTSLGVLCFAWLIFAMVREPPSRPSSRSLSLGAHLVHGLRIVRRHAGYRRLVRTRLLLGCASGIRPFFIVFGSTVWGLSDEVAALFLAVQIGAEVLGAVVAGRTSDIIGNRRVILISAVSITAAAGVAVAAAYGSWDYTIVIGPWRPSLQIIVLSAAFVASGFFTAGLMIGPTNYTIDIAPERKRPSYLAFMSLFTLPLAIMPLLYGWAADALGYRVVFTAGLVLALASLYFATRLPEPRDEVTAEELGEYM